MKKTPNKEKLKIDPYAPPETDAQMRQHITEFMNNTDTLKKFKKKCKIKSNNEARILLEQTWGQRTRAYNLAHRILTDYFGQIAADAPKDTFDSELQRDISRSCVFNTQGKIVIGIVPGINLTIQLGIVDKDYTLDVEIPFLKENDKARLDAIQTNCAFVLNSFKKVHTDYVNYNKELMERLKKAQPKYDFINLKINDGNFYPGCAESDDDYPLRIGLIVCLVDDKNNPLDSIAKMVRAAKNDTDKEIIKTYL